ncbi:MAG: hypothetical protein JJ920_10620 [Roseitalea sp.]|jgi:hypothetical protein|nr:hypothetical protein [Roseitalea sp.]MBO6721599.1 hypothetical protein [Roseitalea sp.]MBO6743355.1 hypothetical protein [Roseitalea sp.]
MAQRARPSRGAGRGGTRKPVTIDLEAENTADMSAPAETAADAPAETTASETAAAEPVAMDQAEKPRENASATEADASPFAKATERTAEEVAPDKPEPTGGEDKAGTRRSAPPPPPPPPARRGGTGAIAGGLIGGLIALIVGAGLQWAGLLPSFGSAPAETVDLAPVQSEIAQLQARLDELAAAPASDEAAVSAELIARIEAAAEAAQNAQTDSGSALSAIETLTTEVDGLRSAMSSGAAGEGAGLEAISGRLDQIETQMASMAEPGEARSNEAVQALGETVAAVQTDLGALAGDVGTMRESVASVETTVNDELAALGARIDANQAALADAQAQLAEGGADSTVVARAIAAAGLKSAIDRGSAFMTELEAYASVAGEDETVTQLRDFAASGVPTLTQLADGFGPIANRIVATGQGLDENASLGDRLMSSARSLVQVRPVGEAEGDTPGAIAARVETRLKGGNLDGALAEWETLPDPAKAASADFMDRVRARQSVDSLVAGALSGAMSAARPAAPQSDATQ